MKIFIAGSMHFAKRLLETKKQLESMGYDTDIAADTEMCVGDPTLNENATHCFEMDIMRDCMNGQEKCDAILVVNPPKHGVDGYIGAHTLIEMGLAYYLKQKIYLLWPFADKDRREFIEIEHMKPIVINNNLEKIK
ncbi:MAG: hypothetical protein WCG48_04045 [Candidatus Berkelbacteria bacterium]